MIERINLIERAPFQFTHGKLVMMLCAGLGFCLTLLLYQTGKTMYLSFERKKIQTEIGFFKSENANLAKKTPLKLQEGPNAGLRMAILQTPPWAKLLKDITERLPGNVWLLSFKGAAEQGPGPEGQEAGSSNQASANSEAAPAQRGMVLNAGAKEAMDAASFVTRLQDSSYVKNVLLTSSTKQGSDFTFVVECDIAPLGM